MKHPICYFIFLHLLISCDQHGSIQSIKQPEQHRPFFHFTPQAHWMNDPNGMVFYNNTWHLFYQYYPDSTVWGPMHWGHATSTDLIHWTHQPIALYPDSIGYIFSGSAVADVNNTSGFGEDGKVPLVAIFTHHDPQGVKAGKNNYQTQSIAYSLDEGNTWKKYDSNPVLKNPGIKDFRDPKVSWHEPTKKWIMTLATLDRITFYSSPDLKQWTKESEFGEKVGAHGGVWECPDLFTLQHEGKEVWVLLVSINPGGPNGGSATQYFTGTFDGHTFTPMQTDTRWIDYGPDDYAGVTWSNTGERKIFLGWMSNWQYANNVPTEKWRSAMTLPRDLSLKKINDKYYISSLPSKEVITLEEDKVNITGNHAKINGGAILRITTDKLNDFAITLSNDSSQKTIIGYEKTADQYYIDRTASGETGFEKGFASRTTAPRIAVTDSADIMLVFDVASVELFADNGVTVMTGIYFPGKVYTNLSISKNNRFKMKTVQLTGLKAIH
ncbi:MAG TPA: glycoside hydrolase family 32 protein [Flavitalea sp.]|nr:glycoside hydrolase family 32 protein [Flavitalea sp.]